MEDILKKIKVLQTDNGKRKRQNKTMHKKIKSMSQEITNNVKSIHENDRKIEKLENMLKVKERKYDEK